jgi:dsRNA-specific ribonuclease/two-component sensor histidine kinase
MTIYDITSEIFPLKLTKTGHAWLLSLIGPMFKEYEPQLIIALIHPSFINENKELLEKFDITSATIDLLEELGKRAFDFAVAHHGILHGNISVSDFQIFKKYASSLIITKLSPHIDLSEIGFFGNGELTPLRNTINEQTENQKKIALGFINRIFGILSIYNNYEKVYSIIGDIIGQSAQINKGDYKTEIQNYFQSKKMLPPEYIFIAEKGPDHEKEFTIVLQAKDGTSIQGIGRSKKEACTNAAKSYLEKYLPNLLEKNNIHLNKESYLSKINIIPVQHIEFVSKLASQFGIDKKWYFLFSQALTTKSYINEHPFEKLIDNQSLSMLGAYILEFLISNQFVQYSLNDLVSQEFTSAQVTTLFCNSSSIRNGYEILDLENGILLGKGEKLSERTETIKSDIFQAIIGASFLASDSFECMTKKFPLELSNWIENFFNLLIEKNDSEGKNIIDSKSTFQKFCQAILIKSPLYTSSKFGPDHKSTYRTSVKLTSNIFENMECTLSVGEERSKKKSEKKLAEKAIEIINTINCIPGYEWRTLLKRNSSHSYWDFIYFILLHEFQVIRTNKKTFTKWASYGFLGAKCLQSNNFSEYLDWITVVQDLLIERNVTFNEEFVLEYYACLPKDHKNSLDEVIYESIDVIRDFINSIDLENNHEDIRHTDEFRLLLNLAKITKTLSSKRTISDLYEVLEDYKFLRKDKLKNIEFCISETEIAFSEYEGTFISMLDCIFVLIGFSQITKISFEIPNQRKNEFVIKINMIWTQNNMSELIHSIDHDVLWKFFKLTFPILNIAFNENELLFHFIRFPNKELLQFGLSAINIFISENTLLQSEYQMIGKLLHELKNQLLGYQTCIIQSQEFHTSRTDQYKFKYEASKYLDNSKKKLLPLTLIKKFVGEPVFEEIEINGFFRTYISSKIIEAPSNIRLEMPKSNETCVFTTAIDYLQSILDNIIKNSIEAMPGGGSIFIEWVYDEKQKELLLEVSDNGNGIPEELENSLKQGATIKSTKEQGSGIGIMSIYQFSRKLEGKADFFTNKHGTTWEIQIPNKEFEDESVW